MRKTLITLGIGTLALFAEAVPATAEQPISISMLWLILSLSIVGLFFWGMYKAMTTKNAKYGYVILLSGILMLASVFI